MKCYDGKKHMNIPERNLLLFPATRDPSDLHRPSEFYGPFELSIAFSWESLMSKCSQRRWKQIANPFYASL